MGGLREDRLDRKQVFLRLPIELCMKVLRKYGKGTGARDIKPEDFFRALRDAIGNAPLTKADKARIAEIIAANTDKRMAARKAHRQQTAARKAGGVA